jgi:hypothetical protein
MDISQQGAGGKTEEIQRDHSGTSEPAFPHADRRSLGSPRRQLQRGARGEVLPAEELPWLHAGE